MLRRFILPCVLAATVPAHADPVRLSSDDLKATFNGALLELDTPLGTTIPIRFGKDGLVSGNAGALGPVLGAVKDRGRWHVANDQLCLKFFRWFDAKLRCLTVGLDGTRLNWRDTSGETGTATLVERAPVLLAAAKPVTEPTPQARQFPDKVVRPAPVKTRPTVTTVTAPPAAETPSAPQIDPARAMAPAEPITVAAESGMAAASEAPLQWFAFAFAPAAQAAARSAAMPQPSGLTNATPHRSPSETTAKPVPAFATAALVTPAVKATPPAPVRKVAQPKRTKAPVAKPQPVKAEPPVPTFQVARVDIFDVLNVRSGPTEYHPRVGAIPPHGTGVRITGSCEGDWCPIRHGAVSGWVNSYYLDEENKSAALQR